MGEPKKVYVVMRLSGAIMRFRDGLAGDVNASAGPYTHILDTIANEMASAGSGYDVPHQLFLNGKLMVEGHLTTIAWNYQQDSVAAREQARRAVNEMHRPHWVTGEADSFYSDPRGWTVTKATDQ